jgi:Tfp pilus assembly protein PilX
MNALQRHPGRRQQGVVLFIALIVLVAMSLAGIALMRSVDTGTLLASNLAFKQGAIHGGDRGIEEARTWLLAHADDPILDKDAENSSDGYFATAQLGVDFLGNTPLPEDDFDWSSKSKDLGTDAAGNHTQYVIHRLCDSIGAVATTNCVRASATDGVSMKKTGVNYASFGIAGKSTVYYRVTVKVTGPRNTVAYVQAMMY